MKLQVGYLLCSVVSILAVGCSQNGSAAKSQSELRNDSMLLRPGLNSYFDQCGVKGCIVVYDNAAVNYIVSDSVEINQPTLPASTFKIINLLIALETNTIESEQDVVKWVGHTDTVKYGYRPEIYHDMTIKEAFEVSAGWVFVELAKRIGKDNYRKYLALCNYGNMDLSQSDDDFWNFGAFAISPMNQVRFLKNLYDEKLPFSKRNIEIVKKVMISEQTADYTVHAKTGWTRDGGINTGWWVGYVEGKTGLFFFATRLLQDRKNNTANFASCRKKITIDILKELNILN